MLQIELPPQLQTKFESRARSLYNQAGVSRALIEAIELWLAQHQDSRHDAEMATNDHTYEQLREELEREHWSQWVVIAHGKLQGMGDTLEAVDDFAADAEDRIVTQIGAYQPREVELGWQASFLTIAGSTPTVM